ncbi:hypothetical protein BLA60_31145, partial [Actinophytocola xinjiangensis]
PVAVLPPPPAATATAALPTAAVASRPVPGPKAAPQRNLMIVAVSAVVVLAAAVTTVLMINSSGDGNDRQAGPPPSSVSSSAQRPAESSESPTPTPTPIPPSAPIGWSEAGQLVINYYGTFTDPAARWAMLSSNAQNLFGSREAFDEYWSTYTNVSSRNANGVTPNADNSLNVPVDVTFTKGDGSQQIKRHVRVTRENGKLVIDSLAQ